MGPRSEARRLVAVPTDAPSQDEREIDAQLVLLARSGDRQATEALFKRHARAVNGLALRLLAGSSDVEDVVQDSFVKAFTRLHRLQDPGAFGPWMKRIVVRTALSVMRRHSLAQKLGLRRSEAVDLDAVVSGASSPEARVELRKWVERAQALPSRLRTVFLLRRIEGLTMPEVAEAMGQSLGTVKRHLRSAEEQLELRSAPEGKA